jgi:hypothetical protein
MLCLPRTILLAVCLTVLAAVPFVAAQEHKSDNWFPVYVDGKAGYIDRTGNLVLEPKYDGASYFSEGLARVSFGRDTIFTEGFSQGFIAETGEVVIRGNWDVVSHFSEGLAAVGYDQAKQEFKIGNRTYYSSASHPWYRWGFIDKNGKIVIDTKFTSVSEFRDGISVAAIPVMSEWKYGFIDSTGKWVIEPKFEHASQFSEGLARVFIGGKYGFIDRNGTIVIKPRFTSALDFSEGLACIQIGGDVTKPVGISLIKKGGRHAFIEKSGREVIEMRGANCRSFSEGLARFEKYGVYGEGFIDRTGRVVIPPNGMGGQSDFSEGLKFVIRAEGKLGFIDRTGTLVIDSPFGKMDDFYRGLAEVCESYDFGAKCGYIDKTGKVVWPPSR